MNFIDFDSLSESSKVIKIIEGEFSELSSSILIKELKSIPQCDNKKLRLFTVKSIKSFEKAKETSIERISTYFEQKKSSTDLRVKWINMAHSQTSNQLGTHNIRLRINTSKQKSSTPTQKKLDKSFLSNVSDVTSNPYQDQLFTNNNFKSNTTVNMLDMTNIVKSKSTKRIFSNSSSRNNILLKQAPSLAQSIIEFIDEMKQLQTNILRKTSNVGEMKKAFERKKANLYQEASKYCNLSSQTHGSTNVSGQPNMANTITNNPMNSPTIIIDETQMTNVKSLNESIINLRSVIEDINSSSKCMTEQLRNEIKCLNEKLLQSQEKIESNEQTITRHIKSIQELYMGINGNKQSINSKTNKDCNSNCHDFDWYIAEISKEIENEGYNHDGDIVKMQKLMKSTSKSIIDIIKPYIKEEESEIDFECFDSKSNYEEEIIVSAIENLKRYIKNIIGTLMLYKKEKESMIIALNESKIKADTYKSALDQTVIKITQNETGKALYTERDNFKRLNTDLLTIQNELLKKLELRDIEAEKNQETITSLIQINSNLNSNPSHMMEKYSTVIQLYAVEMDKVKQLKSDFLHLIQEFSCYIDTGKKINIDLTHITNILTVNEKEKTNESYLNEELSSEEMGRINENDLLGDNNLNINMTKESKCSNKNQVIHFRKNHLIKSDLTESKNKIKKLEQKLYDSNTLIETIGNALEKMLLELHLNQKSKNLFIFIFRLMDYTEDKIELIFLEREKKKINKHS